MTFRWMRWKAYGRKQKSCKIYLCPIPWSSSQPITKPKTWPKITAALFDLNIDGLEILDVDDASPDGTGQVADQLVQDYPGRFHVMHRTGKLGLGHCLHPGVQVGNRAGLPVHHPHGCRFLPSS